MSQKQMNVHKKHKRVWELVQMCQITCFIKFKGRFRRHRWRIVLYRSKACLGLKKCTLFLTTKNAYIAEPMFLHTTNDIGPCNCDHKFRERLWSHFSWTSQTLMFYGSKSSLAVPKVAQTLLGTSPRHDQSSTQRHRASKETPKVILWLRNAWISSSATARPYLYVIRIGGNGVSH